MAKGGGHYTVAVACGHPGALFLDQAKMQQVASCRLLFIAAQVGLCRPLFPRLVDPPAVVFHIHAGASPIDQLA